MEVTPRYKLFTLPTLLSLLPLLTLFTLFKQLLSKRAIIPIHMTGWSGWIPLRLLRLLEHLVCQNKIRQEIPMMSWCRMVRIVGAKAVNINSGAAVWPVHFGSVAVPALFFVIISLSFISIFIISLHCHLFCTATCVVSICLFCMFVICSSSVALCLFSTRIHILFIFIETQTQTG